MAMGSDAGIGGASVDGEAGWAEASLEEDVSSKMGDMVVVAVWSIFLSRKGLLILGERFYL